MITPGGTQRNGTSGVQVTNRLDQYTIARFRLPDDNAAVDLASFSFDPTFSVAMIERGVQRVVQFSEQGRRAHRSMHGITLFAGPPGVGKTQLAMAIANKWSRNTGRNAQLLVADLDAIPSGEHGGTQRNLARCWTVFADAAASLTTFVVFNEIERLASDRASLNGATNPADTMFAVAGMLDRLDFLLTKCPNLHVLATTNFQERVDEAFSERVDLIVRVPLPSYAVRLEVLAKALDRTQPKMASQLRGLVNRPAQLKFSKQFAAATAGMSPRELVKTALQAELTAESDELKLKDLMNAAVARRNRRGN